MIRVAIEPMEKVPLEKLGETESARGVQRYT